VLLGEKVLLVFRHGGCSATSGWTLLLQMLVSESFNLILALKVTMPQKKNLKCQQPVINLGPSHGDSQTSLPPVVAKGNQEELRLLLPQESLNSDAGNCNGRQRLSQAAERGDEREVELLLKDGRLDPNSRDNDCTPLLWVVKFYPRISEDFKRRRLKYQTVAKLLLADLRVDPNCRDGDGRTPLSYAAERGTRELVGLLLSNDRIDPDCADSDGRTPLSRAASENHKEVVAMLITPARLKPESKDTAGRTPLSWAMKCFVQRHLQTITYQDCEVVKLLLSESQDTVDPNSQDQEGRTPLSWAIEYLPRKNDKLPSVFGLLLSRSLDSLASKDRHGRTLLSRAAETGKRIVAERLLERGIKPDLGDDDGRTPLSQAAGMGHKPILDLLLVRNNDVDPNSSDNAGRTPLWWAAKSGHGSVVESLLAQDQVDPESMDTDGHTPLLCAINNKHTSVARLLAKRDGVTLHKIAQTGTIASLRWLLKCGFGINVNIKDNYGRTPLHIAASSGHVNIAKELVHRKADINCEDANGNTPLRVALEKGQQDIIQLLLHHSAQTEGTTSAEWLRVYNNEEASDAVLELSQMLCGRKSVQMVKARRVKMSTETGLNRHLS